MFKLFSKLWNKSVNKENEPKDNSCFSRQKLNGKVVKEYIPKKDFMNVKEEPINSSNFMDNYMIPSYKELDINK